MKVKKRDGRVVDFDKKKIAVAVLAAMQECDNINERTANRIANEISKLDKEVIEIEEIQDIVEEKLMASQMKDVARAYIRYRYKREQARHSSVDLLRAVEEKLTAASVENSNANVDEKSFGGRKGEAANAVLKHYALNYCMSEMARDNHLNNEIYTHDLDSYSLGMSNCLSIPFDDLLAKGFTTRQTDVRPANSVNTALQLVAVIFQLQSLQQFGGCSATHLDWTLVPYVRKSFAKYFKEGRKYIKEKDDSLNNLQIEDVSDLSKLPIDSTIYKRYVNIYNYAMDMTIKETRQAAEGLFHNLNTLQSRSGNQLPFTSINFGTCTLPEGRMVIKALLETSIAGLGALGRTSIFPCSIFQVMEGVNKHEGDPNYDLFQLALESTSKRLYPNYANVDWSGNAGYDKKDPRTYFSTMGCRTANGWDINHDEGVNGQIKDGRGNICPVTIIMPTIAMEAKRNWDFEMEGNYVDYFIRLLDLKIHEAKDMLIERFEYICSQPAEAASFMYDNNTMLGYNPEEGIRSALKHGTLAVGQLGLAETLQILIGKDHTTEEGMELAKRIEQLFKDRCAEFKERYKLNFGVYYTPAESLCGTAMKKFKERYGEIKNISDREYFTNSIHVPVWKKISPFEKIDIESQLTGYSSAGCITYVELDSSAKHNIKALEQLVIYAMDKDIPYFAINLPNDLCMDCGFTEEIGDTCPICGGANIQRLRRVTGYLTGDYKTAFNSAKQSETEDRVKHTRY